MFTFEGPIANVYATLCVRISHSGLFERRGIWKNAATYSAGDGGCCGIAMQELEEGKAELSLFFDEHATDESRAQFEEFVFTHLQRRALPNTIVRRRVFTCLECGTTLTDMQVRRRRERGLDWIECSVCGANVSLADKDAPALVPRPATIFQMDRAADAIRDFEAGLVSAAGEVRTQSFKNWAGGRHTTLAIVFTDIVGSTTIANQVGNEGFNQVLRTHYKQGRRIIEDQGGYLIKTIGDSLMAAFHTVSDALVATLAVYDQPGDERLHLRAGVHVGPVLIEEEDAFGTMVNFASRVVDSTKSPEVRLSNAAREQLDREGAIDVSTLDWTAHPHCEIRGFEGDYTLWSINTQEVPQEEQKVPDEQSIVNE